MLGVLVGDPIASNAGATPILLWRAAATPENRVSNHDTTVPPRDRHITAPDALFSGFPSRLPTNAYPVLRPVPSRVQKSDAIPRPRDPLPGKNALKAANRRIRRSLPPQDPGIDHRPAGPEHVAFRVRRDPATAAPPSAPF